MSLGNYEKKSHQCPPGCSGCIENQRELLLTSEGQNVLYDRYARVINTPQELGLVRACARVRDGRILAIGEPIGGSSIGAVADGNFISKNTFEVAIYKVPSAKEVRGVATKALEYLSDKVAQIARESGSDDLTLVAEIKTDNRSSLHFFGQRGFSLEDPDTSSGYYTYTKRVDL